MCPAKCTRITPAYAGKSCTPSPLARLHWDHPRVCGEKGVLVKGNTTGKGITPAYAGKRHYGGQIDKPTKDHPRVCGEKTKKIP